MFSKTLTSFFSNALGKVQQTIHVLCKWLKKKNRGWGGSVASGVPSVSGRIGDGCGRQGPGARERRGTLSADSRNSPKEEFFGTFERCWCVCCCCF